MTDLLEQLKKRQTPVKNGDSILFLPSTFVKLEDDGIASFTDLNAQKIESNTSRMSHKFLISTPAEDRAGDIVQPKGCMKYLESYKKNPSVFFNHRSSESFPIGKSFDDKTQELLISITSKGIEAECVYHDVTLEARQTYELVELGFLKGASIGFRPVKAKFIKRKEFNETKDVIDLEHPGFDFLEWELLEWSIVGTPCNPEACRSILSSPRIAGKSLSESLRRHFERFKTEDIVMVNSGFEKHIPLDGTDKDWIVNLLSEHLDEVDEKFKTFEHKLVELKMSKEVATEVKIDEKKDETPVVEPLEEKKEEVKVEEVKEEDKEKKEKEEEKKVEEVKIEDKKVFNFGDKKYFDLSYGYYEDPSIPHGAKVIGNLVKILDNLHHCLEGHDVEQPKVKAFLDQKAMEFKTMYDECEKFAKKTYTEVFGGDKSVEEVQTKEVSKEQIEAELKANALKEAQEQELIKALEKITQLSSAVSDKWYKLTGQEI